MKNPNPDKAFELGRYFALVQATLDYYLESGMMRIKSADFDSEVHFRNLKTEAEIHFTKGRLTILKNWFRDLTEPMVESRDFAFNKYLEEKTGFEVDLLQAFNQRIEKILAKGKITTDNQFYDVSILVDQLCQETPQDVEKVTLLNNLLAAYELMISKRNRKP